MVTIAKTNRMIRSMTPRPDIDAPDSDSAEIRELVLRTGGDEEEALAELFSRHGERLERMLRLRLSRRLQGVVSSADVLQEARAAAGRELSDYLANPTLPPFLWLRQITGRELHKIHRAHLGSVPEQDEGVSLHRGALPGANSLSLAAHLLGSMSASSADAVKVETRMHVQEALNAMDEMDREILALRHFERLDTDEIARVLSLSKRDVGKRYLRAIKRLRAVVSQIPGFKGF